MQMPSHIYSQRVVSGDLTGDAAQERVLPELDRLAQALSNPETTGFFRKKTIAPKGLYLWGGVGRGKSMLMDLFVHAIGNGVRRVHFHAFMQEIHKGLHAARADGAKDALVPVAAQVSEGISCLAFDEIQITDITDAMVVGRLFEMLFEAGVTIVATSNRIPDDLYKDGLNRQLFLPFIAFVNEMFVVQELASDTDYRQNRLVGQQVYFAPSNAKAREEINALWRDFGGSGARPLTLTVNKRDFELPAFANGAARAGFYDLCGRALGPADYLAIADAVRVLILEDIPQLSAENFNAAKRFVTLIDALYEARVQLICSAAAEPEMLYLEGIGSFEFERTASRLREMQSDDWASTAG